MNSSITDHFFSSFMRMDPDSGDIQCLIPVEDFSEVVEESESAWRVCTALDEAKLYDSNAYIYTLTDVGTEFDAFFEASLTKQTAFQRERTQT